jgi:hypothetical protein
MESPIEQEVSHHRDRSPTRRKSDSRVKVIESDEYPPFEDVRSFTLFVVLNHVSRFTSVYKVMGGSYTEDLYSKLCDWAKNGMIRGTDYQLEEMGPPVTGWATYCFSVTFFITEMPELDTEEEKERWLTARRESNLVEARGRKLRAEGHRCIGFYERWPLSLHWCKQEPCVKASK